MASGDTNRAIAETPMNQASTRSHCIFTVHIEGSVPGEATVRRSKLHLVDLAGSERIGRAGVTGQLATEGKYINLSLHHLEHVIVALAERKKGEHIPYRNSLLTSVLRDSLGGNSLTTMIATVSMEKKNISESLATCRFAQRVAMIKNEAVLNEELDPQLQIARLKRELGLLKEQLRSADISAEELTRDDRLDVEARVKAFLADPDPEVELGLDGDLRRISHAFKFLKKQINTSGSSNDIVKSDVTGVPRQSENKFQITPEEVIRLKDILEQRDAEITVLVSVFTFHSFSIDNFLSIQLFRQIYYEKRSNVQKLQFLQYQKKRVTSHKNTKNDQSLEASQPISPKAKRRLLMSGAR